MLKAGTDAHLYDDPHDADISRLLDSRFDAEKVEALKRLLALTAQGVDVSAFFPQVCVPSIISLTKISACCTYLWCQICCCFMRLTRFAPFERFKLLSCSMFCAFSIDT